MRTRIAVILVFLAALLLYLPFNANLAVTDPVESNYALPAKEMVLSGDFISPQIYGHYWFDKPIMIYLWIAGCYQLFGINEFAARFPAAICSAASVAFLYWFACKIFINRRSALFSAMALATSLEFWILSRMIITDALLFLFNSISLALLYLGLREAKKGLVIMAYAAAGLAVLTKGPVGIVLPGLIVIIYLVVSRQWKLFGRLFLWQGVAVFFLVAAPWYIIMYLRHGAEFVNTFLGLHNYVRATVSEHPQDNVFYYYLVLFPVSMLPWSGLLLKALGSLKRQFAQHNGFLATWLAVTLIFYTAMATKYPTYVFPAMFPAALLIGREMNEMVHSLRRRCWWWLTLPAVFLFGVFAAGKLFLKGNSSLELVWAGTAIAIAAVLWLQIKGNYRRLPETVAAVTIVTSLLLIHSVLVPLAEQRSARIIVQNLPKAGAIVDSYGDYATSAVFYSGYTITDIKTTVAEEKTEWSGKYTMPKETLAGFQARAAQHTAVYVLTTDDLSLLQQSQAEQQFVLVATYGKKKLYRLSTP
ncbi:MAG: glycosyltransferase family 39 protein [Pelosinus sp.]|nr:glycosyltransferase family 39 protein [Pelosinus sp.]